MVPARHQLPDPGSEGGDRGARRRKVLGRIDEGRDQQRALEHVQILTRREEVKALEEVFAVSHQTGTLRAIATPSRSGTITDLKSRRAKRRRLNSRIPSVEASFCEGSTTRSMYSRAPAR